MDPSHRLMVLSPSRTLIYSANDPKQVQILPRAIGTKQSSADSCEVCHHRRQLGLVERAVKNKLPSLWKCRMPLWDVGPAEVQMHRLLSAQAECAPVKASMCKKPLELFTSGQIKAVKVRT